MSKRPSCRLPPSMGRRMVTSSANAGVARNSAAKSDAPRVLRIISYLLLNRLRSTSIWDIDFECNLKRRSQMRVSRIQAAENRQTVINVASRLFRERGFDGIGLKDLMRGAGLTQGAFYKQFASKEDLAAQAARRALESATRRWT